MSPTSPMKIARRYAVAFGMAMAIVIAAPTPGEAQVCTSNTDCGKGTTCQVSGVTASPGAECAKSGGACEPATVPAPVQTVSACQAAPCQSDSDCGTDMVCHTETTSICSGGGSTGRCAPNTECDPAPQPTVATCTQTTTSSCAYRWQLPCKADVDCGGAFTCIPMHSGVCTGSAGVAPAGGSVPMDTGSTGAGGSAASKDPPPSTTRPSIADGGVVSSDGGPVCTFVTSFPGYCQPNAITCAANGDCPPAWTCVDGHDGTGGGVVTPEDRGDVPTKPGIVAPPFPASKVCQPPISVGVRGFDSVVTDGNGTTVTTTAGGPATGAPSAPGAAAEKSGSTSNSGCAMGGSAPLSTAALLGALLALALTGRRQKSRHPSR